MPLPFTREQFFGVFADYNRAVWPMPVVLVFLAAVALVLVLRHPRFSDLAIAGILSFLWLWMALAYHVAFFARVNPAAHLFAGIFAVEAVLLARAGLHGELSFRPVRDRRSLLAVAFVTYALVGYPLLCALLGQRYPATPTFGLPCPTTIYTLGLLLAARPCPLRLLVIPAFWSLFGTSAAWQLGVTADYGLLVAGVMATVVAARPPLRWARAPQQDSRA
jgi:hypothetical protein